MVSDIVSHMGVLFLKGIAHTLGSQELGRARLGGSSIIDLLCAGVLLDC